MLGLAAFAALGYADTITTYTFTTPGGATDVGGNLAATVAFGIDTTTDALYVSITNDEPDPTSAAQLISGLSFVLSNGGTAGALSNKISSTVGTSTDVTVLNGDMPDPTSSTTTTLPASWQLSYGSGGYFLNDLTGGSPENMIIGPAPYTNANSSINNHQPSLAGTVVFQIDNFTGLNASTTVSSVELAFGTGPDGYSTLCTTDCGGGTLGGEAPEPMTFVLAGAGLLGLGLLKRRRA
jgi:hypothetical protein